MFVLNRFIKRALATFLWAGIAGCALSQETEDRLLLAIQKPKVTDAGTIFGDPYTNYVTIEFNSGPNAGGEYEIACYDADVLQDPVPCSDLSDLNPAGKVAPQDLPKEYSTIVNNVTGIIPYVVDCYLSADGKSGMVRKCQFVDRVFVPKYTAGEPQSFDSDAAPTTTELSFSWTDGSPGTPKESYNITCTDNVNATECTNPGGSVVSATGIARGAEQGTVSGLVPNTEYKCWVIAVNEVGASCSSPQTESTTLATPASPTVDGASSNNITLSASGAPTTQGGAFAGYAVQCGPVGSPCNSTGTWLPTPPGDSASLAAGLAVTSDASGNSLVPNTEYSCYTATVLGTPGNYQYNCSDSTNVTVQAIAFVPEVEDKTVLSCNVTSSNSLSCSNSGATGIGTPVGIAVHGSTVFLTNGVFADSVRACTIVGSTLTNCSNSGATVSNPYGIAISGTTAFIASRAPPGKIRACEINGKLLSPCSDVNLGISLANGPSGITISGTTAYIAVPSPAVTGDPGYVVSCTVSGSTLTGCQDAGATNVVDPFAVGVSGNAAFIANVNDRTLTACTISGQVFSECTNLGSLGVFDGPTDFAFLGSTVFVSQGFAQVASCTVNGTTLSSCFIAGGTRDSFGIVLL